MKLFKKYWLSALAFVMTLVIGSYYTLGGFFSVEKDKVSANVRTVQLSNNEMDYQAILNEFEDSTLTTEGTLTTFTGYQALNPSVFEEIDNLSESDVETLAECKVEYKFTYDTESNVVTIYASMENELGEIEMDTISGVGFINEDGEIDAVMNVDGEGVLLSEMRNAGMIQNFSWNCGSCFDGSGNGCYDFDGSGCCWYRSCYIWVCNFNRRHCSRCYYYD